MRILIVEDEMAMASVLREEFSSNGDDVESAYDGKEAMKSLKEQVPDAVLLDLLLPKKDGFEVLAEMKEDKRLKKVPVVILSNLAQSDDVKRGLEMGADGYLIKTDISLTDIVARVKKIAGKESTR